MKKDIKSAAVVESEAQTLETDKAASAAHDVHILFSPLSDSISIFRDLFPLGTSAISVCLPFSFRKMTAEKI